MLIIVPRTCSLQTSARIDQQQKVIVFASYAFLRMKPKKQKFRLRSHQNRNTLILSFLVLHLDPDSSFYLCSPNAIHNQVLVIQKSGNQKIRSSSLLNENSNLFFSVSLPPQFRRYLYNQSPLARTSLTSLSLVHKLLRFPFSLLFSTEKNCTDKVLASCGFHLLPIPARIALSFFIIITIASSSQNSLSRSLRSACFSREAAKRRIERFRENNSDHNLHGRKNRPTDSRSLDRFHARMSRPGFHVKFKGNTWGPVTTLLLLGTSWGTKRWAGFTLKELLSEP